MHSQSVSLHYEPMKFKLKTTEEESAEKQLWFKAEMTHRQFKALYHKLVESDIENEILNLNYFTNSLKPSKNLQLQEVEMWLKNSWNTENVLFHNSSIIQSTGQSFAMQWAFPQAYYSAFCSILAFYKSVGFTQSSHTQVLKEFGYLVATGKYPQSICMYSSGSKKSLTYHNIDKPIIEKSIELDLDKPETVDNQICQFLKSTREMKSDNQAPKMKFKSTNGKPRKNLTAEMWNTVSDSIGHTTIMDLLYRKRIKANYLDIDTFNSKEFKAEEVLENLCGVINRLNLVNETFVAKAIGIKEFDKLLAKHMESVSNEIVGKRYLILKAIIEASK